MQTRNLGHSGMPETVFRGSKASLWYEPGIEMRPYKTDGKKEQQSQEGIEASEGMFGKGKLAQRLRSR